MEHVYTWLRTSNYSGMRGRRLLDCKFMYSCSCICSFCGRPYLVATEVPPKSRGSRGRD